MDTASLRQQVESIRWYHTIDLGQGVVTKGVDDTPARLRRIDLPASLEGRSVLDIGAWDGFFSFEAERRGASRVVAADHYAWRGLGWGTGRGKAGFDLARTVLGSRVEDMPVDVMDLSPERVGTFDVVLFLGVLYHLPHPLLALERVASVTRGLLIPGDRRRHDRPLTSGGGILSGSRAQRRSDELVGANVPAVNAMLRAVGFDRIKTVGTLPSAAYRAARAVAHRLRGRNSLVASFRQDRVGFPRLEGPGVGERHNVMAREHRARLNVD